MNKITNNNKITLLSAFGVLFLGVLIQLGIAYWNKPDIRYEEGSYYHTGSLSITSLRLKNYGHSDAENIRITANFPYQIIDYASDDPAVNISVSTGGINEKFIVLSIDRLVPSQSSFIYFATDLVGRIDPLSNPDYISSITYKGGTGKTGLPFYLDSKFFLFFTFASSIAILIAFRYYERKMAEIQKISIEIKNDLSEISEELKLLDEIIELIDRSIEESKNNGIILPPTLEEARVKLKAALYGSKYTK